MERNEDTLSTRDLASPHTRQRGVTAADDEQTRVAEAEQAPPPPEAEHTPPPPAAWAGASAGEQTVETDGPAPGLGTESPVPTGDAGDGPANPRQAVSPRDQDTEAASPATGAATSAADGHGSLLSADSDITFQQRWKEIQTRFVDEPRGAVQAADGLVANLMQELAEGFAKERERLEAQWDRGEDISTEDLRVALQRYRTFFQRLLST